MLSLVCYFPEWAESLTEMGKGKHFIGDFLPPEELEKFMETFKALKVSFPSDWGWSINKECRYRRRGVRGRACEGWRACSPISQEGRDPDYSEYKEFKLTVENLGFRMLMKMGWKEGEGLGSESQGIKAPVNKWERLPGPEKALSPFCRYVFLTSLFVFSFSLFHISLFRGVTASNGAGFGIDRPAELTKADDEYDAFRKRMMLAYRFRPNPLVRPSSARQSEFSSVLS